MKEQTTIAGYNAYVYNPGVSAPVLLAFHGKGEMGTNPANLLRAGLPQMMHAQDFTPPKPVYVICPQAPDGAFPADKIPQLLNAVKAKYPQADITKVYTTGFSFGGQTVMEGLVHKPLHALPMSAAAGGNTLVNFIADNRIPITHWTGGNELDNIGWTLYQVNQKVPGLTKTIVRPGIGHCCWNEVLQSAAFWDLIKVDSPPVPTPQPEPTPAPTPEPQPNGDISKVICGEYLTGYITPAGKLFVNKWAAAYSRVECADTGLSNIVDGIGGQYDILVKDAAGQPYVVAVDNNTLSIVKTPAPITGATAIFNLFGAYFAIAVGSLYAWGIDRLKVGATMQNAVKMNMPPGKTIVKLTGASSTGLSDFTIYGLATDGTVWKWNGLTPSQLLFPGNIARDITTVGPYAVVVETASDLFGWGGANPAVIGLAWNQKTPVSIKKQYTDAGAVFPTKQLIGNYNSLHIIDANGNHYSQGNQVMGEVGHGPAKSYSENKNYQWDWSETMYQPVKQIPGKWVQLFSSPCIAFYWYGLDDKGRLFSWGRNKVLCLGNGVTLPAFGTNGYDKYPNAMDMPAPSYVKPLTAQWTIIDFDPNNPPIQTPVPAPNEPAPGITVSAGSDIVSEKTTVNLRAEISGPYRSLRWDVISVPAGVGLVYNIASPTTTGTTFTTMAYGEYIIRLVVTDTNGKQHVDDVKVNIKRPVVTAPVPVGKVKINGFELVMMDKGIYTGTRIDLEVEYEGMHIKLTKNGNWEKVKK